MQQDGNDEDRNLTYRILIESISRSIETLCDTIEKEHKLGRSVNETVDGVLTWLEKFSKEVEQKKNYKKYDCVLTELLLYTVIGSYATLFSFLKIICESLDDAVNPYTESICKIKHNLANAEAQQKEVCALLKKAGVILKQMTDEDAFDQTKAENIDVILKAATAFLGESKVYSKLAQTSTSELIKIMTNIKWFSRIVRLGGWALTCFTLYQLKPSSLDKLQNVVSVDHLEIINKCFFDNDRDKVTFAALCVTSFFAWISLYPSRAYELLDKLNDLKKELKKLEMEWHYLERKKKLMA